VHFDLPVGVDTARRYVTQPGKVAKHAFYPLIRFNIVTYKIKKDEFGLVGERKIKTREISYAAHLDSHVYAYYASLISDAYEKKLKEFGLGSSVLAFRSLGESNIDFAKRAFDEIRRRGSCIAIALDVKGFFDTLDHAILKRQWAAVLDSNSLPPDHFSVYKALTSFAWVDRSSLYGKLGISENNPKASGLRVCNAETFRDVVRGSGLINTGGPKGIPQGTPISAIASNVYMLEFDKEISALMARLGGYYLRYCDDILIILDKDDDRKTENAIYDLIKNNYKLEINSDKTERSVFRKRANGQFSNRPLQYLGFTYDGQRVLIRSAALAKFSNRMKRGVRLAKLTAKSRNKSRSALGLGERGIFKRKLYTRYSMVGGRNFVTYGYRAAKTFSSESIRRQLRPLWNRLQREIEK